MLELEDLFARELESYQTNGNKSERVKAIQDKINKDKELFDRVHHLLGFIESISEQIQVGFVNEVVLYEHCVTIVLEAYGNLSDYITEERKTSPESKELYIHVERLHDKWKNGHSLSTGMPIQRIGNNIKSAKL